MTDELVTFETAKLAKEKGFDEECMSYWEWYKSDPPMQPLAHARPLVDFREVSKDMWQKAQLRPGLYNSIYHPMKNSNVPPFLYARPTQSLLKRWLRERHGLNVNTYPELDRWQVNVYSFGEKECMYHSNSFGYDSYEMGDEIGILEALKPIK